MHVRTYLYAVHFRNGMYTIDLFLRSAYVYVYMEQFTHGRRKQGYFENLCVARCRHDW